VSTLYFFSANLVHLTALTPEFSPPFPLSYCDERPGVSPSCARPTRRVRDRALREHRESPGCSFPFPSRCIRRGVARLSFIARIERPRFYRGGSASTKDSLAASFPLFFLLGIGGSGQGCPRLRASNECLPRPRVLRARRAPGCSRSSLDSSSPVS